MTRPIWLLDVDGVLNALHRDPLRHTIFRANNGLQIAYDPEVLARIIQMHHDEHVEIRWLTTWEDEANTHLTAQFEWPLLELAGNRDFELDRTLQWWKAPIAKTYVDEGRRVVWTDDDIGPAFRQGEIEWVKDVDIPEQLLMISPDPDVGLEMRHLDMIERWLHGLDPRPPDA